MECGYFFVLFFILGTEKIARDLKQFKVKKQMQTADWAFFFPRGESNGTRD